jgi:ankyrin repeat protein
MFACQSPVGLPVVELLLQKGSDANHRAKNGETPLMVAADAGYGPGQSGPTLISILLKAAARVNAIDNSGETALMHAASHGQLATLRVLLEAGA